MVPVSALTGICGFDEFPTLWKNLTLAPTKYSWKSVVVTFKKEMCIMLLIIDALPIVLLIMAILW